MPISCKCILDHLLYKSAIKVSEYDKILRNLKGIEWHPYPQEKPSDGFGNNYLVTRGYGENHYVGIGWHDEFGWHEDHIDANHIYGVTAWAELPKPYEEGAENETD